MEQNTLNTLVTMATQIYTLQKSDKTVLSFQASSQYSVATSDGQGPRNNVESTIQMC